MNTPTTETLRNETASGCAAPGCLNPIARHPTGRPARYCSTACRVRHHRHCHTTAPISVEVDMGSASSRGRPPERSWLVRIRRGDGAVIVAIGLRRRAADRLAEQLTELLTDKEVPAHT